MLITNKEHYFKEEYITRSFLHYPYMFIGDNARKKPLLHVAPNTDTGVITIDSWEGHQPLGVFCLVDEIAIPCGVYEEEKTKLYYLPVTKDTGIIVLTEGSVAMQTSEGVIILEYKDGDLSVKSASPVEPFDWVSMTKLYEQASISLVDHLKESEDNFTDEVMDNYDIEELTYEDMYNITFAMGSVANGVSNIDEDDEEEYDEESIKVDFDSVVGSFIYPLEAYCTVVLPEGFNETPSEVMKATSMSMISFKFLDMGTEEVFNHQWFIR